MYVLSPIVRNEPYGIDNDLVEELLGVQPLELAMRHQEDDDVGLIACLFCLLQLDVAAPFQRWWQAIDQGLAYQYAAFRRVGELLDDMERRAFAQVVPRRSCMSGRRTRSRDP